MAHAAVASLPTTASVPSPLCPSPVAAVAVAVAATAAPGTCAPSAPAAAAAVPAAVASLPSSSASSSPPLSDSATSLLYWIAQFGVTAPRTGLSVWEGKGPAERGLRAQRCTQRCTNASKAAEGMAEETRNRTAQGDKEGTADCPCCSPSAITATASPPPPTAGVRSSSAVCRRCFPPSAAPAVAPILSLPIALLITPAAVRASSSLCVRLSSSARARASDGQLLSLFLILQRRLGDASRWAPYIATLPSAYSSSECWTDEELDAAQWPTLTEQAKTRRAEVRREWKQICQWMDSICKQQQSNQLATATTSINDGFASPAEGESAEDAPLPQHWSVPLSAVPSSVCCTTPAVCFCPPTLSEFAWGWSTVATRSCFLPPVGSGSAEIARGAAAAPSSQSCAASDSSDASISAAATPSSSSSSARDRSCLIPYLDLLNHSSSVRVECRLSSTAYSLWQTSPSLVRMHVGQEVFISYGALSNDALLARYGMALMNNEHDAIKLPLHTVERFIRRPQTMMDDQMQKQLREEWMPQGDSTASAEEVQRMRDECAPFMHCPCSTASSSSTCSVPLASSCTSLSEVVRTRLPRYARALPGFGRMQPFQLALLRACGLYRLADELEQLDHAFAAVEEEAVKKHAQVQAATRQARGPRSAAIAASNLPAAGAFASSSPASVSAVTAVTAAADDASSSLHSSLTFSLTACVLPSDLSLFVRVRVLSLSDITQADAQLKAKAAAAAASSNAATITKNPKSKHAIPVARPSSTSSQQLDYAALAGVLLDESSGGGVLSTAHAQLTRRVLSELFLSRLHDPSSLGRSSMPHDLRLWSRRNASSSAGGSTAHTSSTSSAVMQAPLAYVPQQALLLRLTLKRLLFSALKHVLLDS